MSSATLGTMLRYIRTLTGTPATEEPADSELLGRFVRGHDEAAFAALAKASMPCGLAAKVKATLALLPVLGVFAAGAGWAGQQREEAGKAPGLPAQVAAGQRPRTDCRGDPLPPYALTRLGAMRLRHGESVGSMVFSPDGKYLVSTGSDRVVRCWDPATGRLVRDFRPGKQGSHICQVAVSPDSKLLVLATDPEVTLWNLATGAVDHRWQEGSQVWSLTFSPDGKILAWGNGNNRVKLWDVATGKLLRELTDHAGRPFGLAFSPDGKLLASGGWEDKQILLWDAASGKQLRQLGARDSGISTLAFSSDGTLLASGGEEKLIRLWDPSMGKEVRRLVGHEGFVKGALFAPDGKTLVSAGYDGTLRIWDPATGKPRHPPRRHPKEAHPPRSHPGLVYSLALSPDGKLAATGGGDHCIRLWDVATGKEVRPVAAPEPAVHSVIFAPGGKSLLGLDHDGIVWRWDGVTGKELSRLGEVRHEGQRPLPVLSPDGRTAARAGPGHTIELLEVATGTRLHTLKGHGGPPVGLLFSADGRTLASHANQDGTRLWDVATGKELRRFALPNGSGWVPALSWDGGILAEGGYFQGDSGWSRVWDTARGKQLAQPESAPARAAALALSPDGKTLALAPGSSDFGRPASPAIGILLYEVATGNLRGRLKDIPARVAALAFSPDGRVLACGGQDGLIRLWDVSTGEHMPRLAGHWGAVEALRFSPDGALLASGSRDTTVLVWDVGRLTGKARPVVELSPEQLEVLWADLKGTDAAAAYRAVWQLAAAGQRGVAFLGERLQPAPRGDEKRLAQLIADLDSARFAARQEAMTELAKLGESAESALRETLTKAPSVEVRRRVEQLLSRLDIPTGDLSRSLRALEALERAGARGVLETLAGGAPQAWVTREARAALRRLAK
jgi:WD40 repeat protein